MSGKRPHSAQFYLFNWWSFVWKRQIPSIHTKTQVQAQVCGKGHWGTVTSLLLLKVATYSTLLLPIWECTPKHGSYKQNKNSSLPSGNSVLKEVRNTIQHISYSPQFYPQAVRRDCVSLWQRTGCRKWFAAWWANLTKCLAGSHHYQVPTRSYIWRAKIDIGGGMFQIMKKGWGRNGIKGTGRLGMEEKSWAVLGCVLIL